MLQALLLLVGVLHTASSSPVSGDVPPSRYTVREETFEFGSSSPKQGGEQNSPLYEYESHVGGSDEYEYYPYEGYVYYDYDFDSDEYVDSLDIEDIMGVAGSSEQDEDGPVDTENVWYYLDDEGNVQMVVDDTDDAYKMLEKTGLETCDMDGSKPIVPVDGCAYVSEDGGVHFMGVYKRDEEQPETLPDVIGRVEPCKVVGGEPQVPAEGCVWFDRERNIHLFNVLDDDNREDAVRVLHSSKLFQECIFAEEGLVVPKGGCIFVDGSNIHILGMQEHYTVHDDDDDENLQVEDYDDYPNGDDNYDVSNVLKKVIGGKNSGKTQFKKALFNRRSGDLAKKSLTQKKILSGQKAHKNPARKSKIGRRSNQNTQRTSQNGQNIKSGPRDKQREKGTKTSYKKRNSHDKRNW